MTTRGPLGEAEARAVLVLDKIIESEKSRMDQSRRRGGESVRPIDVPGPLGEFEKYVGDIIRAERQRVRDREKNEGKLVRPKDASMPSALGNVEKKAADDWELLRKEENERLLSLKRFLSERRPMEADQDSPLGVTEAFTVGLLRGPKLIGKVVDRVKELMSSAEIDDEDQKFLKEVDRVKEQLMSSTEFDDEDLQVLQDMLPSSDDDGEDMESSDRKTNGNDMPRP